MKYLKKFKIKKVDKKLRIKVTLDKFISELREELKNIGFTIVLEETYIGIEFVRNGKREAYIDFDLEIDFSLEELIDKCNESLDNVESFPCSEEVKGNYELLCMTILTFLDGKNYSEISKSSIRRYLKSQGRRYFF
jgi:hypothetical protein